MYGILGCSKCLSLSFNCQNCLTIAFLDFLQISKYVLSRLGTSVVFNCQRDAISSMATSAGNCQKMKLYVLLSLALVLGIIVTDHVLSRTPLLSNYNTTYLNILSMSTAPDARTMYNEYEHQLNNHQQTTHNLMSSNSTNYTASVAIGLAVTTRGMTIITRENLMHLPLFLSLIKSFCDTASGGYNYPFFLAYDYNDQYFTKQSFRDNVTNAFCAITSEKCPRNSAYSLHFVVCQYTGKPSWAQNDAMVAAYLSGADYLYRINDDTMMDSRNWTERFIETLNSFSPSLVGVAGPVVLVGPKRTTDTAFLTYDFTHRTHVDIHGLYYPREFPHWYAGRWVSLVYRGSRTVKIPDVRIIHTFERGTRYKNIKLPESKISAVILRSQRHIIRYTLAAVSGFRTPDPSKVIAMSLCDSDPAHTWGVVRNAQLAPVIYPGWTLQIYTSLSLMCQNRTIATNIPASNHSCVSEHVIKTVQSLGAIVIFIDPEMTRTLPSGIWHYLIMDESKVETFLIRNADERLGEGDHAMVENWMSSNTKHGVHCIKDHPTHSNQTIIDGQWGATVNIVKSTLGNVSMLAMIKNYMTQSQLSYADSISPDAFLKTVLYPKLQKHLVYYDSVTCDQPHSLPFPMEREQDHYMGQKYNAHEQPVDNEPHDKVRSQNPYCGGSY